MMKFKVKYILFSVLIYFLVLELIKFMILFYFFYTDESFYTGTLKEVSYSVPRKIALSLVMPLFIGIPILYFKVYELTLLNKVEKAAVIVGSILIYYNIDVRKLFFFVENHRVKLIYGILFCLVVVYFFLSKYKIRKFESKN